MGVNPSDVKTVGELTMLFWGMSIGLIFSLGSAFVFLKLFYWSVDRSIDKRENTVTQRETACSEIEDKHRTIKMELSKTTITKRDTSIFHTVSGQILEFNEEDAKRIQRIADLVDAKIPPIDFMPVR